MNENKPALRGACVTPAIKDPKACDRKKVTGPSSPWSGELRLDDRGDVIPGRRGNKGKVSSGCLSLI